MEAREQPVVIVDYDLMSDPACRTSLILTVSHILGGEFVLDVRRPVRVTGRASVPRQAAVAQEAAEQQL